MPVNASVCLIPRQNSTHIFYSREKIPKTKKIQSLEMERIVKVIPQSKTINCMQIYLTRELSGKKRANKKSRKTQQAVPPIKINRC